MSRARKIKRALFLAVFVTVAVQLWYHPFSGGREQGPAVYEGQPHASVTTRQGRALTSYYAPWIQQDFARWRDSGITKAMVERVAAEFQCQSQKLYVSVVNGTLWVDHSLTQRPPGGWYPAELGGGWVSAKGRAPHVVLALLDVMRAFPGEIPDLEAVFHTHDAPLVPESAGSPAPPVFGYTTAQGFNDVPFPDFSYWGHEHNRLVGQNGSFVVGWDAQLRYLADKVGASIPLARRHPRWCPDGPDMLAGTLPIMLGGTLHAMLAVTLQAMWRGRASPERRDELRRQFTTCPEMFKALRHRDQELFNLWHPDVRLHEACAWRYLVYLESGAWATNWKQKLACGSVVLAVAPTHFEFFSRALVPGVHYVELPPVQPGLHYADLCVNLARQVKHMEAEFRQSGLPINPSIDLDDQTYDKPYEPFDTMPPPPPPAPPAPPSPPGTVAAALAPAPAEALTPQPSPAERLTGKQQLAPWEIGANGQEFLRRHVRMEDVRRYIADALIMYGSLVDFQAAPRPGAVCYSGEALLAQFGFPYEGDRQLIAETYPWLASYAQPGCP